MKHTTFRPRLGHSALLLLALASGLAQAADALPSIQQQWAVCQYQQTGKAKESCLEQLSSQAEQASAKEAFRTDLLIWSAIVKSTWAGAKGGLGALSLVKEAKATLEIAIKQDPKALEGSAYTSLGSLYYQVPGWPVGFGDDDKAEQLLKQALAINPSGIDPNFFYGDFLLDQGRKAEAKAYFDKALAAPDRPGRGLADQGRRTEIRERLAKL
ncbi:tetratricopeptide repeat protein [Aeromonas aquatica]|uniref:tetratricopeptide repeat protein n=1 Tax=Aeromonas aquatica TaxID=558964 RepID=UPI00051C4048|nr:tetratricopeptide repeat protein [Aeromonas aquatica]